MAGRHKLSHGDRFSKLREDGCRGSIGPWESDQQGFYVLRVADSYQRY